MTIPMIGAGIDRVDGRQKVTGGAKYAAENTLENTAYGVLVLSTIPAGAIRAIDATAAMKSPGVLAVLSHLNAPKLGSAQGTSLAEQHLVPFQDATIHYLGQRIAVVVAGTLEQATRGAELVKVAYDKQPARTDMAKLRGEAKDRSQNNQKSGFAKGDADAALASAPVKIDQTYRTPYEHHNPIEAHGIVANWDGDHLTLYDSSQNIFAVQKTLAQLFGMPKENVHVSSQFVGGAFGSKGSSWPHVVIGALAAREVKRPVKLVCTRKQLFFGNGHRPETEQRVALGATPDGKLVAMIHEGIGQGNAVCDYLEGFTRPTQVLYSSPNIRGAHRVVEMNVPSGTYMRAPGLTPGTFALESAMDELAYALKMDPIALRLANYADADPIDNKPWSSKSLKQCYEQAANRFGWSKRTPEPRSMRDGRLLIGYGMASSTYPAHRSPASARAAMMADGTVVVSCGSHEMGMGTATIMSQIAAATLGVPVERVRFKYGDTNLPNAPISAGSMTAASVGSAVYGACEALKKKLAALEGSEAQFDAKPDQNDPYASHAFGAQFAEVSVDPDLGLVRVRRIVSAFAAGRVLNAKTALSQYRGGIIQGLGMALLEQTHFDKRLGTFTNVNLGEYLLPVNADIHTIDVIMVEEDDPHVNPIGVKGIGEIGIVGVGPAIANAVYHATGKRVRDLPITIEKLL
jgi:xanthine dehydrogenase YagR molybdenum-binding subunit